MRVIERPSFIELDISTGLCLIDRDRFHDLPDGRRLCYRLFGAEDGAAVVALHGTPGSRLKFAIAHEAARHLGLRLVSPDRWGYGRSDRPRGRLTLDGYASDIASLTNALGIGRFGVVGISGGGPFATALAATLPERVAALALVAPVAPVSDRDARRGISLFHRFAFRGLPRLPGAVPLAFQYFRLMLAVSPWWAVRTMASRAGRPDRVLLGDKEVADDLVRTFRAGLAGGVAGASIDMRCFSSAWPFDPAAIACPSRMWLGSEDRNVPLGAARRLAETIPGLDLAEITAAGHFWVTKGYPEVLDWLAGVLPASAHDGEIRNEKAADGRSAASKGT